MDNWDDLRFCLALARYKTMSAAAKGLGTNTATVSRRIEKLSSELDAQLFLKDNNKWAPTPLAQALVGLAEDVDTRLIEILQNRDVVLGQSRIVICADLCILQTEIMSVLDEMAHRFESVDFEISMFPSSLAMGEADILLSYTMPDEGRIVRSKVLDETISLYTCAFHAGRVEDWIKVLLGPDGKAWTEDLEPFFGRPARFSMHGLNVARHTMEASHLACTFPQTYAKRFAHLIRVPGFPDITAPVWLGYHESRKHDPVLREVTAWLKEAMRKSTAEPVH